MTSGGKCHETSPSTRMGADGGCGTEEKPCPVSRVPFSRSQEELPSNFGEITSLPLRIDFYTQARKVLSERSPFGEEEAQVTDNVNSTTLPHELASLVSKQYDSKKRQKRSHSHKHKHSAENTAKKVSGSKFWDEVEEYFRPLTIGDVDRLNDLSSVGFSASDKCFWIPTLGNALAADTNCEVNVHNASHPDNSKEMVLGNGVTADQEIKNEVEPLMPVCNEGARELLEAKNASSNLLVNEDTSLLQRLESGVEWLLGARNKFYLPSERPSKKRKLLGGDAGLEKLLVVCPVEGSSSLCHYCSMRDSGDQLNHLIICNSCGVAVHERCYGVQDTAGDSWLCSWCRQKSEFVISEYPCVLCPKQGGALKAVLRSGFVNEKVSIPKFAHLFCCQWMPEVYIADTRKMEPILNVEGIKDTRRKLICYICKRKHGACLRCSNGACRTSFHPLCAREASHRLEIWGKFGCDDVELRVFCSKHSDIQNNNSVGSVDSDLYNNKHQLGTTRLNKPPNLINNQRNGDSISDEIEGDDDRDIDKLGCDASVEEGSWDIRSNSESHSECADPQEPIDRDDTGINSVNDLNFMDSSSFTVILKNLIDQGKFFMKDLASDIGMTPDLLASALEEKFLDNKALHRKIVNWLRSHGYIGSSQSHLKVKIKPPIRNKTEIRVTNDSDVIIRPTSDMHDDVPVKSVPPRRRTKNCIRIIKDNKIICSSKDVVGDDGTVIDEVKGSDIDDVSCVPNKDANSGGPLKLSDESTGLLSASGANHCKLEVDLVKSECGIAEAAVIPRRSSPVDFVSGNELSNCYTEVQTMYRSYIHPLIHHKLVQIQNEFKKINAAHEYEDSVSRENSQIGASSSAGMCCSHQSQHSTSNDFFTEDEGVNVEKLLKDRTMNLLELSPVDEVEEEIIYHQNRLLSDALRRKRLCDALIFQVLRCLPLDNNAASKRKWDAVLINQYLSELREAKKQGRKERRQKEAQAVLAAATAAAAASSRNSSFRKDILDGSPSQESLLKLDSYSGKAGIYSQQILKNSDHVKPPVDLSKEHLQSCDICRRLETILNPILVCSGCKVAVHLDCYRSTKETSGPWYCQLCEELSFRKSRTTLTSGEKQYFTTECSFCGGNAGAFRRSTDGQWIHAFCAEWVLESKFKRGQANPIEGMETISKGIHVCHVCSLRQGVCIKCNYGHCQSTFHPSCARSAGFYMNVVRATGSRLQHKAYCEKHSLEQKAKAETQKRGIEEEFKNLKHARVELERLRLLCERIVKREKLKREFVLCSHGILSAKKDSVALSALARHSFLSSDVSSESATTSLKGCTDGCKSGSELMQRSDEVTVDSAVAGKRRIKISMSMDNDRGTDDSSMSQHYFTSKHTLRASFSGKEIPHRPSVHRNFINGETQIKYRKPIETFEKELVMTSDQASKKNQKLPKGYVYVPVRRLSKDQENSPDPGS